MSETITVCRISSLDKSIEFRFQNLTDSKGFVYNYNPCNGFYQGGINPVECKDVHVSTSILLSLYGLLLSLRGTECSDIFSKFDCPFLLFADMSVFSQ